MGETFAVGLGEICISKQLDDVLVAYGLGSCLGISMYDPHKNIAGLLHAVLPKGKCNGEAGHIKYVQCGIDELIRQMEEKGALRYSFIVKIVGGAHMLTAPGFSDILKVGERNMEAAEDHFSQLNMKISSQEVGGNRGRTVRLYVSDGRFTIRELGGGEREI